MPFSRLEFLPARSSAHTGAQTVDANVLEENERVPEKMALCFSSREKDIDNQHDNPLPSDLCWRTTLFLIFSTLEISAKDGKGIGRARLSAHQRHIS